MKIKNQIFGKAIFSLFFAFAIAVNANGENLHSFETTDTDTSKIYTVVDTMPKVKGGLPELYKFIDYPEEARRRNIEGRVYVKFVVDENGKVKDPQILKDIGAGCGEAAIEGVKKAEFIPGKLNGTPVKVYFSIPIKFELQG